MYCVFYVIVLFSSSIVRHRMPVIFFALALLALLALFTSIVPIVPKVPCEFLHGKVDHLDKLRLLLGQLCQVCHAFFHHFIDRLDKNFSYSLYISYSFLIHYRSYQPSTSFASVLISLHSNDYFASCTSPVGSLFVRFFLTHVYNKSNNPFRNCCL